MKKIILTLIASAALVMGSFAEGYICANDVDLGTYTSEKKEEDGFVLLPASGKPIIVETLDVGANGSEKFTKRLNMKGATCQISFPAKAGETITVEALSSSKTEKRAAVIKDADGNTFTLVKLNNEAFQDNNYIGSVKFPETLEEIGAYAFRRAYYLKSAEFPADTSAITALGAQIFDSCTRLEGSFVWPSQCTTLGQYTFLNTKIHGFYGPSVTNVGNNAFNSCTSLKAIEFGDSVAFGTQVFQNTRGAAPRILFHDAPPVIDANNNLIGNSNGVLDWWGNGNAEAVLYVPFNAAKDGPTENWTAFKTAFEKAVEGNSITWPTDNGDGTWTDGSIYTEKPKKTSVLRFWDPDATTSAALLAY